MKLLILAVGTRMPRWVGTGYEAFSCRMPRELRFGLVEIKPEARSPGKGLTQILDAERARLEAACPRSAKRIVLDEHGELWTTLRLVDELRDSMRWGSDLAFVIGGPDGLHDKIKERAQAILSLSRMTLPHGLVRVLLAEQLYRAASILQNHPYHRE